MSISVICPNSHELKIKEKYAGMTGVCPECKAPISVPDINVFAEDAIMDVLKPHESGLSGLSLAASALDKEAWWLGDNKKIETTKSCVKCRQKISDNVHVCPYCHNYLPPLQWQG